MTLLEYVAEQLIGPPVRRSNGRSTWNCPYHDDAHPSFCTLPPKEGCKDRFRCFGCAAWGDEYDLLKLFFPGENLGQRQVRLDQLRRDYERDVSILHRGTRSGGSMIQTTSSNRPNDLGNVALAWSNLMADFRDEETNGQFALQILKEAVKRCEECNVSVRALVEYWQDYEDWLIDSDRRHLADCDDPNCDAIVCRASRGLPPLTWEEIEEGRRERLELKRQRGREPDRKLVTSSIPRRSGPLGRTKR